MGRPVHGIRLSVCFRAFNIIRDSFPPVILWSCVLLSVKSLPYSAANSCSNLDSSCVMSKKERIATNAY